MSIIKINAITVAADSGDELAKRFAKRAGAVDGQDGFEGFELLQPTDERTTWLVVTRWRDEDALQRLGEQPGLRGRSPERGQGQPARRRAPRSRWGCRRSCGATWWRAVRPAPADPQDPAGRG